jgi:hypothetical protein
VHGRRRYGSKVLGGGLRFRLAAGTPIRAKNVAPKAVLF